MLNNSMHLTQILNLINSKNMLISIFMELMVKGKKECIYYFGFNVCLDSRFSEIASFVKR